MSYGLFHKYLRNKPSYIMNPSGYYFERSKPFIEAYKEYEDIIANDHIQDKVKNKEMLADPGAVAAGVMSALEAGKKIYDLFKKDDSDGNEELINYLKSEFDYIKNLLNEVIRSLADIKVYIDQKIYELIINLLEANLRIFNESYEGWVKDPISARGRIEAVYHQLRTFSNSSQERGYTHYTSIWLSTMATLMLAKLLKVDSSEVKSSIDNIILYFKKCINENIPGSITFQRNLIAKQAQDLYHKYTAKEETYEFFTYDQHHKHKYLKKFGITGNLYQGYLYTESKQYLKSYDRVTDRGHHNPGPRGPQFYDSDSSTYDKLISFGESTEGEVDALFTKIKTTYEQARSYYLNTLSVQINILTLADESIKFYIQSLLEYCDSI